MKRHGWTAGVVRGATAIVLMIGAACGGSGDAGRNEELTGEIAISGSSTVEPISALNAEKFQGEHPGVSISVDGPGTGDGFELFCNGETDISDASRPIEPQEMRVCKRNGVGYIELKIGIDGLSVVTSRENDEVKCLDFKDLYALVGPESEGFETWSDANRLADAIGAGHAPYPDAPLVLTAPGEESGTYDSFVELVLEDIAEERGLPEERWAPRRDYQSSPNDNVIIEGVAGTPTSLGWVGYAFYVQNKDAVKAIAIDGGNGNCVEPSDETVADGSYPIARDLYIYVNDARVARNDALREFVDFYLSDAGLSSVTEVGYVAQPEEEIATTIETWEQRETGTHKG